MNNSKNESFDKWMDYAAFAAWFFTGVVAVGMAIREINKSVPLENNEGSPIFSDRSIDKWYPIE